MFPVFSLIHHPPGYRLTSENHHFFALHILFLSVIVFHYIIDGLRFQRRF